MCIKLLSVIFHCGNDILDYFENINIFHIVFLQEESFIEIKVFYLFFLCMFLDTTIRTII